MCNECSHLKDLIHSTNINNDVLFFREDYDRLSQFVSEKKIRVKNKVKMIEHGHNYNDDVSSDSDHDAYLERMKAEGEDRDSEDGTNFVENIAMAGFVVQ